MKLAVILLVTWFLSACLATNPATKIPDTTVSPHSQAVASAHPIATKAGMNILDQGGNAFDAAIAISATLAVVEPYSSGLGGGGFWLLHREKDKFQIMIDGRERAPLAAHKDLYLDSQGEVIKGLSVDGALAAGIPGEPAALAHIAKHYGQLPFSTSLQPAILAAKNGFKVTQKYHQLATFRRDVLSRWNEGSQQFLLEGQVPPLGYVIKQPHLATTLLALAEQGRDGFYQGEIAEKLVNSVKQAGGIWTLQDLATYQVKTREPIRFTYQDKTIISAAPPSSGGIALATILNILSGYPLETKDDATQTHLIVEAMRRAYRDRAQYLGDPDFVDIPTKRLTNPVYADGLRASIRQDLATSSDNLPGKANLDSGHHTTHFSVLDKYGNRVSATLSINYPFGSGFVAKGTGIVLNDEMDDFSAKPGAPNVYGLIGAKANAITSGKRPLSSMSPTFVESDQGVAILGTPGGSRIITMVLLGILDAQHHHDPAHWVKKARFHHQFFPDLILHEPDAFLPETIKKLKQMGHTLKQRSHYGNMQAIYWNLKNNQVLAASDPRGEGLSLVKPIPLK